MITPETDEDDAGGAEEDDVDEESDATRVSVLEIGDGVGDEEDVLRDEDGVTVDEVRVVDAEEDFKLVEVGCTDTTMTFAEDVDDFVDVEDSFADDEVFANVEIDDAQSPNPAWQPVPQYAEVEPQYPLLEQQFPKVDFLQVRVFWDCLPQRAVVLILRASAPRNGRAAMANTRAECITNEDR